MRDAVQVPIAEFERGLNRRHMRVLDGIAMQNASSIAVEKLQN